MKQNIDNQKKRNPWLWVPSLYFAEGIPYIIIMFVARDMYKTFGISNAVFTFWTSMLYLPWVIKPLWSPFIDTYSTKRKWIVNTQLVLAVAFILVSMVLHLPWFFILSIIVLWFMALTSATHDIAADGFYMLGLSEHQQAFFVGIRSTFYRLAVIAGLGLIPFVVGYMLNTTGLGNTEIHVNAVPASEISSTLSVNDVDIQPQDGDLRLQVFPKDVKVPIYNKNDTNPCDSVNIFFALSNAPLADEEVIVNFGQKNGSLEFKLVTNGHYKFTKDNWNIPQRATIRVDHSLQAKAYSQFDANGGNIAFSWSVALIVLGILFVLLALYHKIFLPRVEDSTKSKDPESKASYSDVFITFFQKKEIWIMLLFLMLYRFAESQLAAMASPFLLDAREAGGLAMSLSEKSIAYGTFGVLALVIGGLLGGLLTAKSGLKKWIWWMAIAINIPNAVYVYLAYAVPDSWTVITACITVEQFGYGFGFTGYMLYMLYVAGQGEYKTAHFALCTGFMALGMMIPGTFCGYVQESLGYQHFFIYILLCTIPSFIMTALIKVDKNFGVKKK